MSAAVIRKWILAFGLAGLLTQFSPAQTTLVATGYLFVIIPKGFFPQQDTGLIIGTSEAAQDISFKETVRRQRVLALPDERPLHSGLLL